MRRNLSIPILRDPERCEHVRASMTEYLDDDLDAAERRRVERHVRFCPRCRRVLRNLRTTLDWLGHLGSTTPTPLDEEATARIVDGWHRRRE